MVSLHVCGFDSRNEIQGKMVLPDMQESSMRVLLSCVFAQAKDANVSLCVGLKPELRLKG